MPHSKKVFDDAVAEIVRLIRPRSFLDLGAGAGKYGKLVRRACPRCVVTGIEIEQEYIDKFNLTAIYDTIVCDDVSVLLDQAIDSHFDIVMAGDLLEHLRKSAGVDLLHFLIYRTSFIIAIYPVRFLQDSVAGHPREAHISSWSVQDFAWCERTNLIHNKGIECVVLRGYRQHPVGVADLNRILDRFKP